MFAPVTGDTALDAFEAVVAGLREAWAGAQPAFAADPAFAGPAGWAVPGCGGEASADAAVGPVTDPGSRGGDPLERLAALTRSREGAAFDPAVVSTALGAMADPGLLRVLEGLAQASRTVDALLAFAAAELAERSRSERGPEGLSDRCGFTSAPRMLAEVTGGSTAEASRLIRVGQAARPRATFTGEAPPRHPHLATALAEGQISVEAAGLIAGMLTRVEARASFEGMAEAEEALATSARLLSTDRLARLVKQREALLDPDGVEPREEELRAARALSIFEDRNGAIVLKGRFDPETGAPIKTALDAIVGLGLREAREAGNGRGGDGADGGSSGGTDPAAARPGVPLSPEGELVVPVIDDDRSIAQRRADALSDLARHALGCEEVPTGGATTVVRIDLADLESGRGLATIDGIAQPVSVATARCMAADGGIIPLVLGGASEILDFGREKRLFTRAQKLALAERDGGCASCGLDPQLTEAHHIAWWTRDTGPSDLVNGVLLCRRCHGRIHRHGWNVEIRDGRAWFIPPAHVDPSRRPRPGGNRVPRRRGSGGWH